MTTASGECTASALARERVTSLTVPHPDRDRLDQAGPVDGGEYYLHYCQLP